MPDDPNRARPGSRRLLHLLPTIAFAATFGVFFVDKSRQARSVLGSWRGMLAVGAVAGGYLALSLVVRRARRRWVAPVAMTVVVLALAAWIVRPYYVDRVATRPVGGGSTAVTAPDPAPPTETEVTDQVQPRAVVLAAGPLAGLGHDARGTASLVRAGDGSLVVRLSGFDIDGVPDPRVHLVRGEGVRRPGGTDLGRLAANRGDLLDIPVPTTAGAGPGWTVLVWCRAFSVPVAHATLTATGA